jgi:hypothetical protein
VSSSSSNVSTELTQARPGREDKTADRDPHASSSPTLLTVSAKSRHRHFVVWQSPALGLSFLGASVAQRLGAGRPGLRL